MKVLVIGKQTNNFNCEMIQLVYNKQLSNTKHWKIMIQEFRHTSVQDI